MTKKERELIKRLAEAYAFLYDLRKTAISKGDKLYILRTRGVEEAIDSVRKEYPRTFQLSFKKALLKAKQEKNKKNG